MTNAQRVPATSADLLADRLAQLRTLVPEAFTEGQIDWDKLRAALGDSVDAGRGDAAAERYTFGWAGKRDAIRLLQTPTRATLIPCPDESVNWDETQHLFLEGDNLEVLKLLYKPYFGRVKMIYIDPPYNTGNDFVYPDDYADPLGRYLEVTGQRDAEGNLLTSNPETSGRYHSAWLSMMYPRLFIARQLLREDGVIFVSIDDHEVHNLRLLMNELFGEENFVDCVVWQKRVSPSNDARWFSSDHDYLLVYARSKEIWRPNRLSRNERQRSYYQNPDNDPRGPWNSTTYTCNKSKGQRPNLYYAVVNPNTGEEVWPRETAVWAFSYETYQKHVQENLLYWGVDGTANMPRLKRFLTEVGGVVPRSVWSYSDVGHTQEATKEFLQFFPSGGFDTPKPTRLISRIVKISTDPQAGDLVLDFFAGSGTTAQAVLALNREDGGNRLYITVQLPEPTGSPDFPTIAEIGKERIRRVIADMQQPDEGQLSLDLRPNEDLGFKVFKLAPSHIRPWPGAEDATPEAYTDQMALFTDPLVDGWTTEGLAYEIALKEGYGLNCTIEPVEGMQDVFEIADPDKDHSFTLCLADEMPPAIISALGLSQDDLFICRDAALTDNLAANLALQCRLKTI